MKTNLFLLSLLALTILLSSAVVSASMDVTVINGDVQNNYLTVQTPPEDQYRVNIIYYNDTLDSEVIAWIKHLFGIELTQVTKANISICSDTEQIITTSGKVDVPDKIDKKGKDKKKVKDLDKTLMKAIENHQKNKFEDGDKLCFFDTLTLGIDNYFHYGTNSVIIQQQTNANKTVVLNFKINETSLNKLIYNWNGTNYTYYNNSLVSMYNFDRVFVLGDTDASAVDVSGSNITGLYNGNIDYTTLGKYGNAITMDGSSYVNLTSNNKLKLQNITVAMWVKRAGTGVRDWLFDNGNNQIASEYGMSDFIETDDKPYARICDGDCTDYASSVTIADTNWHYIAFTHSGTTTSVYVDGVMNTYTGGRQITYTAVSDTYLGHIYNGIWGLTGTMDEVRVWNYSLTQAELDQQLMSNLGKFDVDKWNLYINQSQNATEPLGMGTYTYQLSAYNTTSLLSSSNLMIIVIPASPETTNPSIVYQSPTPSDGTFTSNSNLQLRAQIIEPNLKELKYNWNGTNYTVYDNSLLFMTNYDLGVEDFSQYGNRTVVDTPNGTPDFVPSFNSNYGNAIDMKENRWVTYNSSAVNSIGKDLTVSFWVNPRNTSTSNERWLSTGATSDTVQGFAFYGNTYMAFVVSNGTKRALMPGTCPGLQYETWYRITGMKNDTGIYQYINGVLCAKNETTLITGNIGSSNLLAMGSNSPTLIALANGTIDEIRIWNRSISDNEIKEAYMFNLQKYDFQTWNFYVNQTKNSTNNLGLGEYNYQLFANDIAGNSNQTAKQYWTYGFIQPLLNFVYPTPDYNGYFSGGILSINISILNNSGINTLKFNWNGTNTTIYDNTLVLMYNFDNVSALGETLSVVKDVSLYGNNGTAMNTTYINGKYNNALYFNGVNASVNFPYSQSLNFTKTNQITICAWINGTGSYSSVTPRITHSNGNFGLYLGTSTNKMQWGISNSSLATDTIASNVSYVPNSWEYYCGTYNGSVSKLYRNGVIVGNTSSDKQMMYSTTTFIIGDLGGGADRRWNGTIDEMRIWNRSLSDAEVLQRYQMNLNKYATDKWNLIVNQNMSGYTLGQSFTYQAFLTDNYAQDFQTTLGLVQYANAPTPKSTEALCGGFFNGMNNLSSTILIVMVLTGLVVIVSIIFLIVLFVARIGGYTEMSLPFGLENGGVGMVKAILLGLASIVLIAFTLIIAFTSMCQI